jgi:4-amino-4-deoxy-L-arabinose transferase-like glycosyltransferase
MLPTDAAEHVSISRGSVLTKKARKKEKARGRGAPGKSGRRQASRGSRARRPLDSRVLIALAVIILVGLALRVLYLRELTNAPDFEFPLVDSEYHDYWARGMAFGNWSKPRFEPDPGIQRHPYFRPPGYPFFLAAVYKVTGRGYLAPRVVQTLLGLVNALLLFFITRRLFGDIAALVAAALASTYWILIYFEGEFLEPTLAVLLVLALVYALMRWLSSPSNALMLAAGVVVGAFALVRPNALLWVPVVGLWVFWVLSRRGLRRKAVPTVTVLVAGVLIAVVPVTVRNAVVGRDFVPISSNGGINLFIGNNERADGLVRGTMPGIGTLDTSFDHLAIVRSVEHLTGRPMKHSEVSDYLADRALAWMRANPGKTLGLVWKKTLLFWGPTEPADNKVVAGDRAASEVLSTIPLTFLVVFGLSIAGVLLLLWQRRSGDSSQLSTNDGDGRWETSVLMLCLILVWYASHLPFAVTARYRVPIFPLLFMFSAYFCSSAWQMIREKDWRRSATWGLVLAVALALGSIDLVPSAKPSMARWHYQRGIAYFRGRKAERAISEYREALDLNPEYSAVHNDLAALLAGTGRVVESIPHFRKALEDRPNDARLHFNLALALEMIGAIDESAAHYRRALSLTPGDREAAAGLARTTGSADKGASP